MHQTPPPSTGRKKMLASLSPIHENLASPTPRRHSRTDNQPIESHQKLELQAGFILFLAIIQIFIILNLLNGSLSSHSASAMIKISYSRHQLHGETTPGMATTDTYSSSELMNKAILDIASLRADTTMSPEQQIYREKALRAIFNADRDHHTLDPTLLCRSEAFFAEHQPTQQQPQHNSNSRRHGAGFNGAIIAPKDPYFDDHSISTATGTNVLSPIPSSRVILSTYFGSRVDPYRCFELPRGKLTTDDAFHLLHPLVDAVERLDLTAVIFHDGALSDEFVANVSSSSASKNLFFQKVELQQEEWSLADERWLIFSDWLRSSAAAEIEWVLTLDFASTTLASDPFDHMESSEWLFSLWADTVPATPREISRFSHCYAHYQQQREPDSSAATTAEEKYYKKQQEKDDELDPDPMVAAENAAPVHFLEEGDLTFNSGVVGGTKTAFLSLAYSVKEELERLQIDRGSSHAVWNCEEPALHRVLKTASLQGQRVFTRGHPFVGDVEACTEQGNCDYAIYREF